MASFELRHAVLRNLRRDRLTKVTSCGTTQLTTGWFHVSYVMRYYVTYVGMALRKLRLAVLRNLWRDGLT